MASINAVVLCLILSFAILSASSQTNETSQMSSGLCSFKILVVTVLPTIAFVFFLLTPLTLGFSVLVMLVGYFMHKKNKPDVKIDFRKPGSMHIVLKIGLIFFVAGILLPIIGIVCIILAVILPILASMVAGGATSSC